jgi:hypothetical protein
VTDRLIGDIRREASDAPLARHDRKRQQVGDKRVAPDQIERCGVVQDVIVPVLQEAKEVVVPIAAGYAGGLASRPKDPNAKERE